MARVAQLAVIAALLVFAPLFARADDDDCGRDHRETVFADVLTIGLGGGGATLNVMLEDLGISTIGFEAGPQLGWGGSNTFYFTPPSPGLPGHADIGISVFQCSSLNASGTWQIDTAAFASRFANITLVDYTHGVGDANYAADFSLGYPIGLIPPQPPTPAYIAAFEAYMAAIAPYGSWLDTGYPVPSPFPAELAQPFWPWVVANNLTAIVQQLFRPLLNVGGMGDFLTVKDAMSNVNRATIQLFTTPESGFVVTNGTQALFDGIARWLGPRKVKTSVTIERTIRPPCHRGRFGQFSDEECGPVKIHYTTADGRKVTAYGKRLVLAMPQTLDNIASIGLQLTPEEYAVFSQVTTRVYAAMLLNVSGALDQLSTGFILTNIGTRNPPFDFPVPPAVTAVRRDLPYGPASAWYYSNYANQTLEQMQADAQRQLDEIPDSMLTEAQIVAFKLHNFNPHFNATSLLAGAYQQLYALNDNSGPSDDLTYVTGALLSFSNQAEIWNYNKILSQIIAADLARHRV